MPRLSEAIKVERQNGEGSATSPSVFSCNVDQTWSVAGKPHGGYLLSLICSALSEQMKGTSTPDPAHMMVHYFVPTLPGPAEIQVTVGRKGKSWTNLKADLIQKGQVLLTVMALYTNMPDLPTQFPHDPFSTKNQTLLPGTPSAFAPLSPFETHPTQANLTAVYDEPGRRWSKESVFFFIPKQMRWAEDRAIKKRRETTNSHQSDEKKDLEWGAWLQLNDERERLSAEMLPFYADMMSSVPEVFPDEKERVAPHYYPTLALSLQFHTKLPLPTSSYPCAQRTIGCYSKGQTILNGRHEQLVEIWSAPAELSGKEGEQAGNEVDPDWRAKSMLLVTSTQLALSIDASKLGTREEMQAAKAKL